MPKERMLANPGPTARLVYWKKTDKSYWIQWPMKDGAAVLWTHDRAVEKAVKVRVVQVK
jgi:hypothetical protein